MNFMNFMMNFIGGAPCSHPSVALREILRPRDAPLETAAFLRLFPGPQSLAPPRGHRHPFEGLCNPRAVGHTHRGRRILG